MVSNKVRGVSNVLAYKDEVVRLVGNVALASNLCHLFGVRKDAKNYRAKLVMMTVFVHLLGSNLFINLGP